MSEIRVKSTGTIKLFESDNTSHVTIASPASLSANRTITIPDADVTLGAGTTINNNADNRVITGSGTANTLEGESGLTYNGETLTSTNGVSGASVNSSAKSFVADSNHASGNGFSILSKNDASGAIFFGDAQNNARCIVKYNHSTDKFLIDTTAATAFSMDQTGAITTVLQPGFSATKSTSSQTVSAAYVDVSFNNEIWDNNADWNGSTTFTAPVTGKYMFSGAIRINDILAQGGSVFGRMGTSNRNYLFGTITDADDIANATIAAYQFQATVIADMDANDTMTMAFFSNFQTTIDNDAERTWLQGYLLG